MIAAWQHQVALLPRLRHPRRAHLLGYEGLEALLVPNDGRLDIDGDDIKLGGRDRG